MPVKISYRQQVSYCGKPRCRKCRERTGHGPYWYAYKTVDGQTTRTYVGKTLPPDALATMEGYLTTSQREQRTDTSSVAAQFIAPGAAPIGRSHQGPLVGRQEELMRLYGLLATIEQNAHFKLDPEQKAITPNFDVQHSPQSILLMGEVGIGKTRLAEEISQEARRRNWAVAWGRIYAQEENIPYCPWTRILRKTMEQGLWQRDELTRRSLVFQPLCSLQPELHDLLPPLDASSSQSPEQQQLRLWEAIRELLLLISKSTSLLITLDDLQWADGSSCELLAYLARRVSGHPILIVGTCRNKELPDGHVFKPLLASLLREHTVETIPLQPLSNEQIGTLISHLLYVPNVPEPLASRIGTRAAGNPFFAEELARTVSVHLATHPAKDEKDNISATAHKDLNVNVDSILPDTITAALDLRLGRLSQACVRLLNKAAVLGGSFEFNTITEMEANIPGSDEDVVLELLEEALRAGMLTEEGTGLHITYQFWHPLLPSHLYEKLSAGRRASLHRRAAEILQHLYQGDEEDGAMAITHHLLHSGADRQKIAHFAELAGNRAYRLSSFPDAGKYYRIAAQQLGTGHDAQERLAYLLEFLGECSYIEGMSEKARRFYEQALEIHQRASLDNANVAENVQLQALLLCEIATIWRDRGNNREARACYEQGEQILRAQGLLESCAAARIRHEQGHVYAIEGKYEDARRMVNEALKLFEKIIGQHEPKSRSSSPSTIIRRALYGDPIDPGRAHWLLGLIADTDGQSSESLMHYKVALALYEQHSRPRYIAIVSNDLGNLYLNTSQYTLAQAAFRRSLDLAERIGHLALMCLGHGNLGVLALRLGNLEEAELALRKGATLAEEGENLANGCLWYAYLATVLLEQGRLVDASVSLYRALKLSRASQFLPYLATALVAVGSLRIAQAVTIGLGGEGDADTVHEVTRVLRRASNTLQRALHCEGVLAETRTEGRLALAQVNWLLGDLDLAYQQATQVLEDAHQSELVWLEARAQRILGGILVQQQQLVKAVQCFEQALQMFRKCGMCLEETRTLQTYGEMLLKGYKHKEKEYQRGMGYLREARRMFIRCHAELDVRLVKRLLKQ